MRYLFISITNIFIMMSLVLTPIVPTFNAYAKDPVDCEQNKNADGSESIYKVGCEFNNNLSKTKVKDHYPDGVKGIIEQFVSAAFAMIGVSLFWKPNVYTLNSCKECATTGGAKTFPIVQAGTLAYLVGELKANSKFREASKIAVDSTFSERVEDTTAAGTDTAENTSKNEKQIKAYDALIQIYDKQASGLKTKKDMALVAEAAFLYATYLEYADSKALGAYCESQVKALGTQDQNFINTLISNSKANPECSAQVAVIQQYISQLKFSDKQAAINLNYNSTNKEFSISRSLKSLFDFIVSIPKKMFSGGHETPNVEDKANTQKMIFAEVKMNEEKTTKSTFDRKLVIEQLKAALIQDSAIQTNIPKCTALNQFATSNLEAINNLRAMPINCCGNYASTPKTITLDVIPFESVEIQQNAANGTNAEYENSVDDAAKEAAKEAAAIQAAKEAAAKQAEAKLTADMTNCSNTSYNAKYVDKESAGSGCVKTVASKRNLAFNGYRQIDILHWCDSVKCHEVKKMIKEGQQSEFIRPVIENLIHRIVQNKMIKNYDDPVKQLNNYAQTSLYLDNILMNGEQSWNESNLKKELADYRNQYKNDQIGYEAQVGSIINKLKNELMIVSANASVWKDLLNIGVKAYLLHMVMWEWMEAHALNYPKARMWTWGTMAAVNLAVYAFDSKSYNDAKKRKEVVELEKNRFLKSHALGSEMMDGSDGSNGSGNNTEYNPYAGSSASATGASVQGEGTIITCATPNGSSFIPAQCPSRIPVSTFGSLGSVGGKASRTNLTGELKQGLGAIGVATQAAATSANLDGNTAYSAAIKSLEKTNPALRALNERAFNEIEAIDKKRNAGNNGFSLKESLAKVKSMFSGNVGSSGVSSAALSAGASDLKGEIEKVEKEFASKGNYTPPKFDSNFQMPSMGGSFDTGYESTDSQDFGDINEKRGEALSNLDVDTNEVNENTEGNLFRLISNRYLRSYPILLEEKK